MPASVCFAVSPLTSFAIAAGSVSDSESASVAEAEETRTDEPRHNGANW